MYIFVLSIIKYTHLAFLKSYGFNVYFLENVGNTFISRFIKLEFTGNNNVNPNV